MGLNRKCWGRNRKCWGGNRKCYTVSRTCRVWTGSVGVLTGNVNVGTGSVRVWKRTTAALTGSVRLWTGSGGVCRRGVPACSLGVSLQNKGWNKNEALVMIQSCGSSAMLAAEFCSAMAVAIETVQSCWLGCRGDVMVVDSQQDHSWTWTVCAFVCVWLCYIIRAKFVFFVVVFFLQASRQIR